MKTRDPWRVVLPMGRPQTFSREADARAYAEQHGGTVEEVGARKREARESLDKATTTDDIPPEIRQAVRRRSRGYCEIRSEGCGGHAAHMHHRLKRRHGIHTVENLVDTCWNCHTASPRALHRNVGWARSVGLLIDSWENPPTEPWTRDRLNA